MLAEKQPGLGIGLFLLVLAHPSGSDQGCPADLGAGFSLTLACSGSVQLIIMAWEAAALGWGRCRESFS